MKVLALAIVPVLWCQAVFAEAPRTPEAFLAAVRAAYDAKDVKKLDTLTWTKGASNEDLEADDQANAMVLSTDGPADTIRLGPVDLGMMKPMVLYGKRIDMTYTPKGTVVITFKPVPPRVMALS
jgi:hypothetical protein